MNIFYSKKTLSNNLLLVCEEQDVYNTILVDKGIIFLNKNEHVIGFNIAYDNPQKYDDGRWLLTQEILNDVNDIIKPYCLEEVNSGFIVGEVVECKEIVDTHLHECKVNIGSEYLQIVCGAKNVRKGIKTVVALTNTMMNSGLFIKPSKLKGCSSNGMLCSQKELGISGFNNEGIIELDNKYNVGEKFKPVYKNI